ncbi:MAG TPA: GAF domain-containing protein [Anaerolineales bacterium]
MRDLQPRQAGEGVNAPAARPPAIRFRAALALGLVILLAHLAGLLFIQNAPLGEAAEAGYPLEAGLAGLALLYAARRLRPPGRSFSLPWLLFSLALFAWALGAALSNGPGGHLLGLPVSLSAGAAFGLLYYPLFIAGVLALPAVSLAVKDRLLLQLDAVLGLLVAVIYFWNFQIGPSLASAGPLSARLVSLVYPALDLMLLAALASLLYRRLDARAQAPLLLLAASLLVQVLVDSIHTQQLFASSSGHLVEIGWAAGFLLAALAGLRQVDHPAPAAGQAEAQSRPVPWLRFLPLVTVVLAFLLLLWSYRHDAPLGFEVQAVFVGGILVLLIGRQIAALDENRRLAGHLEAELAERRRAEAMLRHSHEQLAAAHDELEMHVTQRTAELAAVNTRLQSVNAQLTGANLALNHRLDLERLASAVSANFSHQDPAEIDSEINRTLEQVGSFSRADRTWIFAFSGDGSVMDNTYEWCAPGIQPQIERLQGIPCASLPWWMDKFSRLETVHIPQVSLLPPEAAAEREMLQSEDIQSLIAVPLVYGSALAGFIGFDSVRFAKVWADEDILLLKMLGEMIVNALERKRAEQALRLSEAQYRAVVEQTSEGIVLYDFDERRVLDANPAYLSLLGYSLDEIRGMSLYDLVVTSPESAADTARQVLANQYQHIGERQHRRKDGSLVDVDVSASLISFSGRQVFCVLARDITRRKLTEQAIQKRTRQLEALRQVGLELTAELNLEALLRSIVSRACDLLESISGGLYLYRPDLDRLELAVVTGPRPIPHGVLLRRGEGLAGQVWETGRSMTVTDYASWEGRAEAFENAGFTAVMAAPLRWGDELLGVVDVLDDAPRVFTPADVELLGLFATQAAIAIRNARTLEAEERERSRAEALAQATIALTSTLELAPLLENTLNAAIRAIPAAQKGSLLLLDEATGELCVRAFVGFEDPRFAALRFSKQQGYSSQSFYSGRPLLVEDAYLDEIRYEGELEEVRAIQSAIVAPLVYRGQARGVLSLDNINRKAAFTPADLALLAAFASQAAVAIENSSLFQQIRSSLHEKEVLLKEIHHRVKNNMQIISSLLSLQSEKISDPQALEMLGDSQTRIRSMALIHEKLYRSKDLAQIDFGEYIRSLAGYLFRTLGGDVRGVRLDLEAAEVFLGVDTAVPCGLVLNELLSNALKHAFPEAPGGSAPIGGPVIRILLQAEGAGRWVLTVADNGVGFPPGLDFTSAGSLGLQLVASLVEQLGGRLELDCQAGTTVRVRFPAPVRVERL